MSETKSTLTLKVMFYCILYYKVHVSFVLDPNWEVYAQIVQYSITGLITHTENHC